MEIKKEDLLKAAIEQYILKNGHEPSEYEQNIFKECIDVMGADGIAKAYASYSYHYEHPDYRKNLKPIISELKDLAPDADDTVGEEVDVTYETICEKMGHLSHAEQVDAVNNLVLHHLVCWHYHEEIDATMYPVRISVALMEHFKLHECLPVFLELLRQNFEFLNVFFRDDDLDFMLPGILYQIIGEEDLPTLLEFMKTAGLLFCNKKYVALAVANLPRKDADTLSKVQKWLEDVIKFYVPMGAETDMFDENLLDALIYCCIHTHAVNVKDVIIRLYNKYKLPNIMVKGGVTEVRKSIKKAPIGTLDEQDYDESGERVFLRYLEISDVDDWDDEDDQEGWDDAEGYEDFDLDEYDWNEYQPWAQCRRAEYKPILATSLKKYRLKVVLQGTKPEIWREFEVPSNLKLTSLAGMILYAMGWDEDHLHQFVVAKTRTRTCYATSYNELSSLDARTKDGRKFCIGELVKKVGDNMIYEYDYGDGWMHTVTLTAVNDWDGDARVKLLDGKRACPPEDCGGIPGYRYICQAMKHLDSAEAQELIEWMGCKFDPERFPIDKAKKVIDSFNYE